MVYITITSFLFLLRYLLKNENVARNQIYYIIFLALFLFSAYRYQVGCDWYGYYKLFLRFENFDYQRVLQLRDPFSMTIFYWISKMNLPYPYVFIPFNIIFFIGVHLLARRQPDPLSFLVLLFPILIINMTMSGVRQAAAIGIICIALTAFIDRRPIRFGVWVFLASAFHSSAIVFTLLLPFASGRYNNTRLAIATLFTLLGLFLITFSDNASYAFNAYIGSGREAYGAVFRVGVLALSALYFFLFAKQKWKKTFPEDYSLVNLGAFGMILTLLLIPLSTIISDRFGYYFIVFQAIIFARLPYLPFKNNHSLYVALPYLGILLVFLVWTQTSWHFNECYMPYKSWILGLPGGNILR